MPINNGSNIRVETNVGGVSVPNDEWLATRSYIEHQPTDPSTDEAKLKALQDLYAPPSRPPAKDKRISKANNKDLRTRNIQQ